MTIFSRKTPEQKFWQWFVANSDRLMNFESDQEAIFDELSRQMHKVHNNLTFEFGPIENGKREFTISADGVKEAFPAVQSLAAAAPVLERWNIIPFRQPINLEFTIRFDDYCLTPDDVWFSHESDRDQIGLILYIRGLTQDNEEVATRASFIMLDCALGEYDVETKVSFIERQPLPVDPAAEGLLPLTSIREVFDKVHH